MSFTVPSYVKPSGGLVLPSAGMLPGIPKQPTADQVADAALPADQPIPFELTPEALQTLTDEPRTWSFISNVDGALVPTTCPDWCDADHENDRETPSHPHDIWHQADSNSTLLPVSRGHTREEVRVLSWSLRVRPFDTDLNLRLPHASVEIMEDEWVEDLDPDAFENVIDTLEERVKAMRRAHAELLRVRAEYKAGR